jgi:hypothetical protein
MRAFYVHARNKAYFAVGSVPENAIAVT